jgi:tRNA (guanine37-N1)-methyltransferase
LVFVKIYVKRYANMANYDIIGNIAIIKFQKRNGKEIGREEKLAKAKELLENTSVKGVYEKADKIKGRLRVAKLKYLFGEKNLIAEYKESNCKFKLNIEKCYFSPRLAGERMEVAKLIEKEIKKRKLNNVHILVMFSGVAPFSIVIAKTLGDKINKINKIISIELGKECCKYAIENVRINKLGGLIEIIQGDAKKIIKKLIKENKKEKFDFIVMPRPNLKEAFLKEAFSVSKKGTKIIYYMFSQEKNLEKSLSQIHKEAKKYFKGKKERIKIINIKEAGDIAPYEHRYRVEMDVL